MDVQKIAAFGSIAKDLKDLWDSVSGDDRKKVDALVRKVADVIITSPDLTEQKDFLVNGPDELPLRLTGYFLHKNVQKRLKAAMNASDPARDDDSIYIVKCRQCGGLQDISRGDLEQLIPI